MNGRQFDFGTAGDQQLHPKSLRADVTANQLFDGDEFLFFVVDRDFRTAEHRLLKGVEDGGMMIAFEIIPEGMDGLSRRGRRDALGEQFQIPSDRVENCHAQRRLGGRMNVVIGFVRVQAIGGADQQGKGPGEHRSERLNEIAAVEGVLHAVLSLAARRGRPSPCE